MKVLGLIRLSTLILEKSHKTGWSNDKLATSTKRYKYWRMKVGHSDVMYSVYFNKNFSFRFMIGVNQWKKSEQSTFFITDRYQVIDSKTVLSENYTNRKYY